MIKTFFGGDLLMVPSQGSDCKHVPEQVVTRSKLLTTIANPYTG